MREVIFGRLADLVVVIHLCCIVFAVLGGLLVLRWRRLLFWHLAAVFWAAMVEFIGLICPLTPLEKGLRAQAGTEVFSGGFVEHYLVPIVYPAALTRGAQVWLGVSLLLFNAIVYWHIYRLRSRSDK